jgi:hypothetical protein
VWEKVFDDLIKDRDNQYLMLDSTLVRAHQQETTGRGSGQKKGPRSGCGALPRWTDNQGPHGLGRPVRFLIAPGESHDILAVPALLEGHRPAAVLADRAYDAGSLRQYLDSKGLRLSSLRPAHARLRLPTIP